MSNRTTNVLALSLGQGLAVLFSLLTGAVIARQLTIEGLASYRQAFLAYSFAAPFLMMSLPQALYYFIPGKASQEKEVLLTNVVMLVGLGAIFSLGLRFGGATLLASRFSNPDLVDVIQAFQIYPVFMFPIGAVSACLVAKQRVGTLTIFNVVSQIGTGTAVVVSCFIWPDPRALVVTNVLASAAIAVPAVILMAKSVREGRWRVRLKLGLEMLKYSIPLGMASLFGTMTMQMSGVVVSSLRTPAEFAVFSVGAVEVPMIGIITGSISTVILADMAKECQSGDHSEALRLFQTASVRSATILLPTMFFMLAAARPFVEALYSSDYSAAVVVFQSYLLLLPIRIVYYGPALMALGKTKVVLVRSIVDFGLCTVFTILFVSWIGYLGAALALALVLYGWTVPYNLYHISRGFNVRISGVLPFRDLGRILLYSVSAGLLGLAWLPFTGLPRILQLVLAAVCAVPPVTWLFLRNGYLPTELLYAIPIVGRWLVRLGNRTSY